MIISWAKMAFEVGTHAAGLIWEARGKKERMEHEASRAKVMLDKLRAEAEVRRRLEEKE